MYFQGLYYEVFYFFLILSFLPISLHILRFSISFIFLGVTIFSIFSSFLYFLYFYAFHVLYFELPLPFTKSFLSRKYLSTGLYYGADNCVSHTNDVEGLMNFVVRYLPEWMNILRRTFFETAIHFAHSNHH